MTGEAQAKSRLGPNHNPEGRKSKGVPLKPLPRERLFAASTLRIGVRPAFLAQVSQRFMNRLAQPTLR